MARLSPVNMPQAPYSDMPLDSSTPMDTLKEIDEARTRERQAVVDDFNIANMAQDREFELQKREAELADKRAQTRQREAEIRKTSLESDVASARASQVIDAFQGYNIDQMPPALRREAEEINRLLQGPMTTASEVILAGRIQALRGKIRKADFQAGLGFDLSRANGMRMEGEGVSPAMQAVMADLGVLDDGTYDAYSDDERSKFESTLAEHSAALRAETEQRMALQRTTAQRQEWQTRMENMVFGVDQMRGYRIDGRDVGQRFEKLFERFDETIDKLGGNGFGLTSTKTHAEMTGIFNSIERQFNMLSAAVDGADENIGNLADELNSQLVTSKGIQDQFDEMQRNIGWMTAVRDLEGDSPVKDIAMGFLSPDIDDLYSERWDEGSLWETNVKPMIEQIKRVQAVYAENNAGQALSFPDAARLLHQQGQAYTEVENKVRDSIGGDLDNDKRSSRQAVDDEVDLITSFAQTMPNSQVEPYAGYLDPTVDAIVNAHGSADLSPSMLRAVGRALVDTFPEFAKQPVPVGRGGASSVEMIGMGRVQKPGVSSVESTKGPTPSQIAAEVLGLNDASGAQTEFPVMFWLAEQARQGDAGREKVAKFLARLSKTQYGPAAKRTPEGKITADQ